MKISFVTPLVFVLGFGSAHGGFVLKGREDLKLRMNPGWMDLSGLKGDTNGLFGNVKPATQATGAGRTRPFGHKSRFHHKTHSLGSTTQSATSTPITTPTSASVPDPSQASDTLSSSSVEPTSAKSSATSSVEITASASPPLTISSTIVTSSPTSTPDAFEAGYLNPQNALRVTKGAVPLIWNNTLATYAQNWASDCEWMHSGGSNGENLAAGTGSFNATGAVALWTAEESSYNPSSPTASHYTQVVWKSSTQLGCDVVACNNLVGANTGNWQYHVCEYYPHGNVDGEFSSNVEV